MATVLKRETMKRAKFDELDKAVYLWFIQQRCKGTPVSGPLLMSKALQMYPLVCQAIETVLTYLEQQPFTPMTTVVTINGL